MKNKKVKKIIFRTDEDDCFDIPKIKGSEKKKLEIDAPDACFDNEAAFKSITLIDAYHYTDEVRECELYNQIAEKLYTGEYEK